MAALGFSSVHVYGRRWVCRDLVVQLYTTLHCVYHAVRNQRSFTVLVQFPTGLTKNWL